MNASGWMGRLNRRGLLAMLPFALLSMPLHAETPSVYEISYTLGQDALTTLDAFSGGESLRPGFRNDMQRSRELSLELRSTRLPSADHRGFQDHSLETRGGFIQRFGSSGFGYGVDLGVGLRSSGGSDGLFSDQALGGSSFMITDLSTGPTFDTGNLRSRMRVGVRYPLLGESDPLKPWYGHRGDTARSAGYLSLDSRLRFSNQTEMSVSLFYDDYGLASGTSRDWLNRGLDFEGGAGSSESVIGFEMGLNF